MRIPRRSTSYATLILARTDKPTAIGETRHLPHSHSTTHHVQKSEVGTVAGFGEGAGSGNGRVCQTEEKRRDNEGRNASDDTGKPLLDHSAEKQLLEKPWRRSRKETLRGGVVHWISVLSVVFVKRPV